MKISLNNTTFCVKIFICVFFTLISSEKIPQIILPLQDFRQENRYGANPNPKSVLPANEVLRLLLHICSSK